MLFSRTLVFILMGLSGGGQLAFGQTAVSAPLKIRVGIAPAEDRWVTLTDGGRVYQGVEISMLLGHRLLQSGKFNPIYLSEIATMGIPGINLKALGSGPVQSKERWDQIPAEWKAWVDSHSPISALGSQSLSTSKSTTMPVAVVITPVVETLLYSSGERSNRMVYGFSPSHENPFNAGREGSLDNEFISSQEQKQFCEKPDFFSGKLKPGGWGPFKSNYGTNFDEGFMVNVAGFGFGFKKKAYEVLSQVRFLVDDLTHNTHQELIFQTRANGLDLFVAGSYAGFSLGVEIQRRETLVQALRQMLPQIIDNLISQGFNATWESSLISIQNGLVMGAGEDDGVTVGLRVTSRFGAIYEVEEVHPGTSLLKQVGGLTKPFKGEPLRVYTGEPIAWGTRSLDTKSIGARNGFVPQALEEKTVVSEVVLPANEVQRATSQTAAIQDCFGKKSNWIVETVEGLFSLYAWWRYSNIHDQPIHNPEKSLSLQSTESQKTLRIALIDTGIDYNDKNLRNHVVVDKNNEVLGFDFISWDHRPSDDNGHGTAAAKMLVKRINNSPLVILPLKVIGPRGETHSSAIYDAFKYSVDQKVDAILVPWASASQTLTAYKVGAGLAANQQIPVFVPASLSSLGGTVVPPSQVTKKKFKSRSLGSVRVQLEPEDVVVVEELASWINSHRLGGRYDSK